MGRPLVIVAGQSNALNPIAHSLPAEYLSLPGMAWKWGVYGGGTALKQRRVPWAPLRATNLDTDSGAVVTFPGPDLVIAKTLQDAGHDPTILLCARGGTSLAVDWAATTGPLYVQLISEITQAFASTKNLGGYTSAWLVWIQGENDTLLSANSLAYASRFVALWAAFKSDTAASFSDPRAVMMKISTSATYCSYLANQRAQVDVVTGAHPDVLSYDSDPCAVGGDAVHFTEAGCVTLGTGIANAMIAAGSL